ILAGDNALIIFPTGAGKSLRYQVRIHAGITLVVSPLIVLMKDQVDALKETRNPSPIHRLEQIMGRYPAHLCKPTRVEAADSLLRPRTLNNEGFVATIGGRSRRDLLAGHG
ncbi:hypothetical protein N657DRAFT_583259, partial [Parathielavia appendiculata]